MGRRGRRRKRGPLVGRTISSICSIGGALGRPDGTEGASGLLARRQAASVRRELAPVGLAVVVACVLPG
jgi:hypothetical protein